MADMANPTPETTPTRVGVWERLEDQFGSSADTCSRVLVRALCTAGTLP